MVLAAEFGATARETEPFDSPRGEEWAFSRTLEWDIWVSRNIYWQSPEDPDFSVMIYLRNIIERSDDEYFAELQSMTDRAFDALRDHTDLTLRSTPVFDEFIRTRP